MHGLPGKQSSIQHLNFGLKKCSEVIKITINYISIKLPKYGNGVQDNLFHMLFHLLQKFNLLAKMAGKCFPNAR